MKVGESCEIFFLSADPPEHVKELTEEQLKRIKIEAEWWAQYIRESLEEVL